MRAGKERPVTSMSVRVIAMAMDSASMEHAVASMASEELTAVL